jgi:hypothetical protein
VSNDSAKGLDREKFSKQSGSDPEVRDPDNEYRHHSICACLGVKRQAMSAGVIIVS